MVVMARAADSFNSKASSDCMLYVLYQYGPTKESSTGNRPQSRGKLKGPTFPQVIYNE